MYAKIEGNRFCGRILQTAGHESAHGICFSIREVSGTFLYQCCNYSVLYVVRARCVGLPNLRPPRLPFSVYIITEDAGRQSYRLIGLWWYVTRENDCWLIDWIRCISSYPFAFLLEKRRFTTHLRT